MSYTAIASGGGSNLAGGRPTGKTTAYAAIHAQYITGAALSILEARQWLSI